MKSMTPKQRIEHLKRNGMRLFPGLSNEQRAGLLYIDVDTQPAMANDGGDHHLGSRNRRK